MKYLVLGSVHLEASLFLVAIFLTPVIVTGQVYLCYPASS